MDEEANIRQQLVDIFHADVADHEDVMQECISICRLFKITPQDLFIHWETFDLSHNASVKGKDKGRTALSVAAARDLKASIQRAREVDASRVAASAHRTAAPRRSLPSRGLGRMGPAPAHVTPSAAVNTPSPPRVSFREEATALSADYRYMDGKVSQRSEVLDDIIDEFGEMVRIRYGLEELGDPSAVTEEEVVVVGRICTDADAKLNETSVLLEASRMSGSGARVPIRFNPDFAVRAVLEAGVGLFPGCIAAFKGRNGGGGWFAVSEALDLPPLPLPRKPDDSASSSSAFTMVIASGPYTSDADLLYRPFEALTSELSNVRPGVVVLLGPFVDAGHPLMRKGDVDYTPCELFQRRIAARLHQCLQSLPGTTVLLVPSVRDLVSPHAAFPQTALSNDEDLALPKTIHLAPNPCAVTLNGVTVTACTVDALLHLRKEEFFKRSESSKTGPLDPMATLARHILVQRSFYPIFPPPRDVAADVNLDLTHAEALRLGPNAPAILIVPSVLKQFNKVIDGTLVINPSHLSRGNYAYVQMPDVAQLGKTLDERRLWDSCWKTAVVDLRKLTI